MAGVSCVCVVFIVSLPQVRAIGTKARVFLVLVVHPWWILDHAHEVFDEICVK
jgi:hypothetical protein